MAKPPGTPHPADPAVILDLLIELDRALGRAGRPRSDKEEDRRTRRQSLFGLQAQYPSVVELHQDVEKYSDALVRVLPRLRDEDVPHLSESVRGLLLRLLPSLAFRKSPFYSPPASVAFLDLLAKIGGEESLRHVTHLADEPAQGDPHHERIRAAAAACRDAIDRRLERDRLLRPATPDQIDAAILLRPAQEAPPEQLLRPADGGEGRGA